MKDEIKLSDNAVRILTERPLAVTGICYISVLAAALIMGKDSFLPLSVIFLACGIFCIFIKNFRKFSFIFITGLTAVSMLWGYTYAYIMPSISLKGTTREISGTLCELPYKYYDRYYYKLKTDNYTVLVSYSYKIKIEPFDTLKATVNFYGENNISQDLYNLSKGIILRASVEPLKSKTVTKNNNKPLYYYALTARKYMTDKINSLLPERESALVNAIMTGDKYNISENEKQILRSSGISHIVVISGFHIAVIARLMLGFFMLLTRRRKKLSSALSIIFIFLYMAVTGFTSPVFRAGIMQGFILIANMVSRKSDSFNMLGLSALVICFRNPYAVADVSFIMSFTATFGILLLSKKISVWTFERISTDKLYIVIKSLVNIFAVSLSAYIFILPVTILYFRQASLYAVITNLFVSFAVTLLIYISVFMIITGFHTLAWAVLFLSDYILNVAESIANLPLSLISTSQEFVPFWLITAVIFGLGMILFRPKPKIIKYYAVITVISFIILSVSDSFIKKDSIKISVLDVGDGISCIVNRNNRIYLLSSGGSYSKSHELYDYLTDSCIYKITYMLMLDDKNACTAFSKHIIEHYDIETVQVFDEKDYTQNIQLLLSDIDGKTNYSTVKIDDVMIQAKKNKNCMAVKAVFGDLRILLAYNNTDCENLPENWLDTDIFIVSGNIKNSQTVNSLVTIISDETNIGNIALRAYPNKNIELRREKGWLN